MLGPAGILINIEPGVNYFEENESPIFSLHCTRTNECQVKIITIDNSTVMFPPYSFIAGAVYHIYLKQAEFEKDKASFIGYKLIKNKITNE